MLWMFRLWVMNHQALWTGTLPPPGNILLEDNLSFLLLEDNVSKLTLEA